MSGFAGAFANIPQQSDPTAFLKSYGAAFDQAQAGQAAQRQNSLRQILAQPGAIDPTTGMPSADAFKAVMAVDPATGMKLQQNALAMSAQREQLQNSQLKRQAAIDEVLEPVRVDSYTAYQKALKGGASKDAAMAAGQRAYSEGLNGVSTAGHFSEDEQKRLLPNFDPDRVLSRSPTLQKMQQGERTNKREDVRLAETMHHDERMEAKGDAGTWQVLEDTGAKGADGAPVPYRYNAKTAEATTLDGKPYTPLGAGKVGAPAKAPVAGSIAANRAAIADDVANDPEFKSKSKGEQAQEIESRMKMAQGTLSTPEARHSLAEGIASYSTAPLSGFSLARPEGQQVMAEVRKINPDYSAPEYSNINKTITNFGAGKQGDVVRSLNVAVQHIDVMSKAAEALKNGDVRLFNSIGNEIARQTGQPAPTSFNGLKQIVGTEIEKAVAGGIGASADREALMKALDGANSPEQLAKTFADFKALMAGQALGLKNQYESGTPDKAAFRGEGQFAFGKKLLPETARQLGLLSGEGGATPATAAAASATIPPAAAAKLKKGVNTTFGANGTWTLDEAGNPKRVR